VIRAAVLLAALTALPPAASADEMSDKLCPILSSIAASTQGYIPEAVQAQVVIDVGGAYDHDHDALMRVLDEADATTSAACPDARAAILAGAAKDSLTSVMR
jgi:hypothetical protein